MNSSSPRPRLSSIDPTAHISTHFTWGEVTTTRLAVPSLLAEQHNPPAEVRDNLERLCRGPGEDFRDLVGRLRVTSGYRCPGVNEAAKGAGSSARPGTRPSAHLSGRALDLQPLDMDIRDAFKRLARSGIEYDKAIYEYGSWIHLQIARPGERRPARKAFMIFAGGGYEPWRVSDPRFRGVDA